DDEEDPAVELEHDPLADAAHAANGLAVQAGDRGIDGAEDEGADEKDALEPVADDVAAQRLEIDNDVGKFRQSLPQPLDDLLTGPVMIVVEVQDDCVERQPFVAADRASATDVLEAVEQAIESRPHRDGIVGQRIRAFVRGAERARSALAGEVFTEGLRRSATRTLGNRVGELDL